MFIISSRPNLKTRKKQCICLKNGDCHLKHQWWVEIEDRWRQIGRVWSRPIEFWTSQPSSNDQSALMHPYCVYKCELIYIGAKHPQDGEWAPLEPNTNYICLFLWKWPLSTSDQCGHQRSAPYIFAETLACNAVAHLQRPQENCFNKKCLMIWNLKTFGSHH